MPHNSKFTSNRQRKVFGIIEDRYYDRDVFHGSGPKDYQAWLRRGVGVPAKIEHGHRQFGKVTEIKVAPVNNYLVCELTFDDRFTAAEDAWKVIQSKKNKERIGLSFRALARGNKEKTERTPYQEICEVSLVDDPVVDNGYVFAIKEGDKFSVSHSMGYHLAKTMLRTPKIIDIKNSKYSLPEDCVTHTNFSKNKDSLLLSHYNKMENAVPATTNRRDYNAQEWRDVIDKLEIERPSDLLPLKRFKKQREDQLESQFREIAQLVKENRPDLVPQFSELNIEDEAQQHPVVYDFMFSMLCGKKRPVEAALADNKQKAQSEEYTAVAQKQETSASKKRTFAKIFFDGNNQHAPADMVPVYSGEPGKPSDLTKAMELGIEEGARILYKEEQIAEAAKENKGKASGTMAAYFS